METNTRPDRATLEIQALPGEAERFRKAVRSLRRYGIEYHVRATLPDHEATADQRALERRRSAMLAKLNRKVAA